MKPASVAKHLFKGATPELRKLEAQARKERRETARAEFKRTEEEAGRWNQQKPRL